MSTLAQRACNTYGPLPQGWTRRRLRFDVRVNPKKSALDLEPEEFVSFVPMDAIGEYGGLGLEDVRELAEVYDGYTYFADGDVCIAKITPSFENGKGALAEGLTNGVGFGTTELHVVRPGRSIDRHFLFYVSIAHDFRKLGEREMHGAAGQKRVDESFIKDRMPHFSPTRHPAPDCPDSGREDHADRRADREKARTSGPLCRETPSPHHPSGHQRPQPRRTDETLRD